MQKRILLKTKSFDRIVPILEREAALVEPPRTPEEKESARLQLQHARTVRLASGNSRPPRLRSPRTLQALPVRGQASPADFFFTQSSSTFSRPICSYNSLVLSSGGPVAFAPEANTA